MGVSGSCYRCMFYREFTVIGQCMLEMIVVLTLVICACDHVLYVEGNP